MTPLEKEELYDAIDLCLAFDMSIPQIWFCPMKDSRSYGLYSPNESKIIIFRGAPKGTLIHELAHFFAHHSNPRRHYIETHHGPLFENWKRKIERRGYVMDLCGRRRLAANNK